MESLHQLETVIMLLVAVLVLTTAARHLMIPYPILLVIGGLILGFIPGLPRISLNPDLVFLVFLPPILWSAAYFTSLRDFRAHLRPIALLAIGLVLVTTAAVAVVAHVLLPGLSWAGAIVLGAIVSPPDAVAATGTQTRRATMAVTLTRAPFQSSDPSSPAGNAPRSTPNSRPMRMNMKPFNTKTTRSQTARA